MLKFSSIKPRAVNLLAGFTLIEAIVSTAVFALIISAILGVYISTIQLDHKTRAQRAEAQNARFIMEYLAKEIRNGSVYYPGYSSGLVSGTSDLYLEDQANLIEHFYVNGTDLVLNKNGSVTNLNSVGIKVNKLKFFIQPAGDPFTSSKTYNEQPRVTVAIQLTSNYGSRANDVDILNLESSFATRSYPSRVAQSSGSVLGCATGGNITTSGLYTIHTFTSNGTFSSTCANLVVDYLVVSGGGAGGTNSSGGGGGGGGVATGTVTLNPDTYSVQVGNGGDYNYYGVAGVNGNGENGGGAGGQDSHVLRSDSSILVVADGGGGAGPATKAGENGSSGGGGGSSSALGGTGPSGWGTGVGHNGGKGGSNSGGGGGGAGAVGTNGSSGTGGNGGNGVASSISGSSVIYGGGGAGRGSTSNGTAGTGGGGAVFANGTANTGGGGGGGSSSTHPGLGGSGIVILRYLTSSGGSGTPPPPAPPPPPPPVPAFVASSSSFEDPLDKTESGTDSATGSSCSGSEGPDQAFDNLMTSSNFSKWCNKNNNVFPASIMYDFSGSNAFAIQSYTITTGNDAAARDPLNWTFQGCQGSCSVGSDTGWVTIDTQTNQFNSAARYQTNTYAFSNSTAYQQYRLRISANHGDTTYTQLTEIQMFDYNVSGSPSIVINQPAGTAQNNVMVASIAFRPSSATITPPSGWNLVRRVDNNSGTTNSLVTYMKVAGASEPANYSWSFSSYAGSAGGIVTISNANTTTPVNVEGGQTIAAGGSNFATSNVTTTAANTILITAHTMASAATWTPPSGMTEAFEAASIPVLDGSGISMEMNYVSQATAGATGAKTAVANSTDNDCGNTEIVAVQP